MERQWSVAMLAHNVRTGDIVMRHFEYESNGTESEVQSQLLRAAAVLYPSHTYTLLKIHVYLAEGRGVSYRDLMRGDA